MPALVDIIGATLPLKRRGRDHWCPCPFHSEKTSSFKVGVWKGRETFHCFGCGARGDAADWIMRTQNVNYVEAKRILGEPVKPDPAIIAARKAHNRRERILATYRNRNVDCCLPDWAIGG